MRAARRLRVPKLLCCAVLRGAVLCCVLAVKGGRAARRRAAELGGHPGGAVRDAGLQLGRSQARRLALSTGKARVVPRAGSC